MTADDVRARFEAWVQKTRGWAACKARNKPMYLRQTADGNYCDYRVNDRWMAYRAAHADLSGEVRELVEAAESSGDYLDTYFKASNSSQPADWMDAALLAKQWHCRIAAALAKFTQEKP